MTGTHGGGPLDSSEAAHRKKKGKRGWSTFPTRGVAILLLAVLTVAIGAYGFIASGAGDRIAAGVSVTSLDMSDKTKDEAIQLLRERVAQMRLTFIGPVGTATLDPAGDKTASELAFGTFKVDDAVAHAFSIGKGSNKLATAVDLLRARLFGRSIPLPVAVDSETLRKTLESRFGGKAGPAQNARLVVKIDPSTGAPTVTIAPEKEGWEIDFRDAARQTETRLQMLADAPIDVLVRKDQPDLTVEDVSPLADDVAGALERTPLHVTAKGEAWTISKQTIAEWLTAVPSPDGKPGATLALDAEKAKSYLSSRGASIATEPIDAAFEEKDGRVVTFRPGVPGQAVDVDVSFEHIERAIFAAEEDTTPADRSPRTKTIELPMTEVQPSITTESSNPYGIKEVIGIGATNFRGSPRNRVHNISVGAKSVDGTLVPPGEEFSMMKTLGAIDGDSGYLQELVIKGNKTTPEYGGGLCQIGSTAFRAALDSGLLITARQNHSYRVPYYERDGDGSYIGPGKDATIYDPAPDFRFLNDTGRHILVKTAIEGSKLSFTFWGVKDGRKAEQTKAKIYNIVEPPEKKIIPTTDLKPGEEKCTEHAHVGSDAIFTYTVTAADGTVTTKDFKSHYRPWQEVCLLGVDPTQMPPADGATVASAGAGEQPAVSADASGATGN